MPPNTFPNRLIAAARRYEKIVSVLVLLGLIFVAWTLYYQMGRRNWQLPLGFGGDGWLIFGTARAYMNGEIFPFFSKMVPTLNAPFVGNWNDYPITEDLIYALIGWLGKLIGLFAAGNVMLLLAHMLAGLTFWWVSRTLGARPLLAMAGALVYAFCNFIMSRGFGHLPLTWFWHVPLLILVTGWVYADDEVPGRSARFKAATGIALLCGVLNPYYTGMFLQFLGFGVLLHAARRQWSRAGFALVLIAVAFGGFLLMNLDTLLYGFMHGSNAQAAARDLAALDVYGMKIPELILPPGVHVVRGFSDYSQLHYYTKTLLKGEFWSPYLGLVALLGVGMLVASSVYRLMRRSREQVSPWFWLVIWVLLYSMIGGFNLVLGSFGFVLFRGTNRYSIFILTMGLLFLVLALSRHTPRRFIAPVAFMVLALGWGEAFGPKLRNAFGQPAGEVAAQGPAVIDRVGEDRRFALSVEAQAPGAMVYQLPVAAFPEVPPVEKMGDYEHFRPYLYTRTLHYSYGNNKGRGLENWQSEVAKLAPAAMAAKLESYGFSVVMVNRSGYGDQGAALLSGLEAAGKPVIASNADLVALRLQPAKAPVPIDPWASFGAGWSGNEGTHRWAETKRVRIELVNAGTTPLPYILSMRLGALRPQVVSVSVAGGAAATATIANPGAETAIGPLPVMLKPGSTWVVLETGASPVSPGNGDTRMLTFRLSGFRFEPAGN